MRNLGKLAALAAVYLATAKLGLSLDAVSGFATLVWPPTGIALAALLLYGLDLWPGIALGALIANIWVGAPPLVALGICAGNTLEAATAYWLLQRVGFRAGLRRVRDAIALIAFAALLATSTSATVGVTSLMAAGVVTSATFAKTWLTWWIGDVVGALVVAPVLLVWLNRAHLGQTRANGFEAWGLLVYFAATTLLVFGFSEHGGHLAVAYLYFPPLTWATLRFGPRGAVSATLVTATVAVLATMAGLGPFVMPMLSDSLLALQVFVATTAATFLVLGALAAERSDAIELLHASNVSLERSVTSRDEFISVASHELRTPLTPLLLRLDMLEQQVAGGEPPVKMAESVAVAKRQVERLIRLVDGLVEVSRSGSGRTELHWEEIDMTEVARDFLARFAEAARREGCDLTLHASEPVRGMWDESRLDGIVGNLLANAIKYGAGKPIALTVSKAAGSALLAVRDNGIGIEAEHLQRIFGRYERAVSPRAFGGLGLGLYIAKEAVTALGGKIWVESKPGAGATFNVELPLERREGVT